MNHLLKQQLLFYTLKTESGLQEPAIHGIIRYFIGCSPLSLKFNYPLCADIIFFKRFSATLKIIIAPKYPAALPKLVLFQTYISL